MGSKGRIPPPHLRRQLPGPGMGHPDPFGPAIHPPPGGFPPFDMLPPPEIMEQKLATQHVEMQKLATENQRLAATHVSLRQELAAAQHELQMLHANIGDIKSEREQQMRGLMDKIARMEAELRAAEPIKKELHQAQTEAQSLVAGRQELISNVQQLNQDLQRTHSDIQQIPFLLSELDGLRQEYQHCRATYDYEKKLYNDHLESLQVMEKNYLTMAREVEKLRADLANSSNFDRRTGLTYGGNMGYSENDASGNYPVGPNAYGNGYGVLQGRGPHSGDGSSGAAADAAGAATGGATPPVGAPSGSGNAPLATRAAYDAARGPTFDTQRGPTGTAYDAHRGVGGPGYDAQRGNAVPSYEAQRGLGYEAHRRTASDGHGPTFSGNAAAPYNFQRGSGYDGQRGGYNPQKSVGYDSSSRAAGSQGQAAPVRNAPYESAAPSARGVGMGYEAPPRGGNAVRR
ncbi:protein FLX-like 2 [Coffea arabica]|uniref:Protein FLX-like 2 n=1 Tax=Coffea arabica TaxID=13443 RepID=A0A6P6WW91_COFAR|nr:protein FLX-like 2 [Coffea arabica]